MRGRKPKPTRFKLIEGNPGKRPINIREPLLETKAPTCPAHLSPTAKAEWKRLAAQLYHVGILTAGDRAAMAAYCQSYSCWVEAEKRLKETPMLIKLPSGYIQPSPWLTIANKQLELMHRFMSELGLSPTARTRVDARPPTTSKFAGLLGAADNDEGWA